MKKGGKYIIKEKKIEKKIIEGREEINGKEVGKKREKNLGK